MLFPVNVLLEKNDSVSFKAGSLERRICSCVCLLCVPALSPPLIQSTRTPYKEIIPSLLSPDRTWQEEFRMESPIS